MYAFSFGSDHDVYPATFGGLSTWTNVISRMSLNTGLWSVFDGDVTGAFMAGTDCAFGGGVYGVMPESC
ncbi:MAG: hypothetical protein ACLU4N_25290 [Butyricimonas faecihominis]